MHNFSGLNALRVLPLGFALILSLTLTPAWAQEKAPSAAPVDLASETNGLAKRIDAKAPASKSAYEQILVMKDAFLAATGLQEGNNPTKKGKHIYTAIESVAKPVSHPDFAKLRVTAYDRAYLRSLEDFIKSIAVRVKSETLNKYFSNQNSDNTEFDEADGEGRSRMQALFDKAIAAEDAQMNEVLLDLGVEPSEFDAADPDQKKILISRSLITKTIENACKSLGGVSVVQTFFTEDDKGEAAVGVVLAYSPLVEGVADALRTGRKPAIAKTGKPLSETLPLDSPELLYDMMGTRLLTDENGPVVIAFGQWANSYQGTSATMAAETRNAAFRQAEAAANRELSAFLNQSFTLRSEAENGEVYENAITKSGKDGSITEAEGTGIVDVLRSQASRRTNSLLSGATTLKRWTYQTPQGHEVVGVVKAYSFASIQESKGAFQKPQATTPSQSTGPHEASARAGAVTMDLDTF